MAIAVRELVTGSDYDGTSSEVSIVTGAGTAAGDLLVVFHGIDYSAASGDLPTPTGNALTWTARTSPTQIVDNTTGAHEVVWTAPVGSGGAVTVTLGINGSDSGVHGHVYVLSGVDSIVGAGSTINPTSATNAVAPSPGTGAVGDLLLCAWQGTYQGATSFTIPGSMSNGTTSPTADQAGKTSAREAIAGAGAVGTRTATQGGANNYSAAAILLRPASDTNASAGHASGTGAAHNPTVKITPAVGHASGTGAAHNPTVVAASNASAGHASGTGVAHTAAINISVPAGHASGSGAAHSPAAAVTATAGHAAGTGVAHDTAITITAPAGHASGAGAAHQPAVQADAAVTATAGHAAGTAAAHSATVAVVAPIGHASGTGEAFAAIVPTGAVTTASAGHASGVGVAYAPTILARSEGGGNWQDLAAVLADARLMQRADASQRLVACPDCGEPLRSGPRGRGLFCSFDGQRF